MEAGQLPNLPRVVHAYAREMESVRVYFHLLRSFWAEQSTAIDNLHSTTQAFAGISHNPTCR